MHTRSSPRRGGLRHPSDLTDDEWANVAPMIPPAKRKEIGGNAFRNDCES